MQRMAKRFWLIGLLGWGILSLPACADLTLYYSADPIEAKVIDADTKQPLEGVIVTANWQLMGGNIFGTCRSDS